MTSLDARPPSGAEVLDRQGVRALLVDARERVLLFVGRDPDQPERGTWWFTPGGGLHEGEPAEAGLAREVLEETGLVLDPTAVSGPVWTRMSEFLFGGTWYRQRERFWLVRVDSHEVDTTRFEPLEASAILGHRWWSLDELAATDDVVYPRALARELRRVLRDGAPGRPYEVA